MLKIHDYFLHNPDIDIANVSHTPQGMRKTDVTTKPEAANTAVFFTELSHGHFFCSPALPLPW